MSISSRYSSLTPCPSPSPEAPIVQPDHFYGSEGVQLPPSPNSTGKTWLDPDDDPAASRGIPVFKPTMEEFRDFEGYMERVNCWGLKSGIVKVIPPKEWSDALPDIKPQLREVKIRSPIEQIMLGSGGLFRQQNMEKRRIMSVREWAELCSKDEYRAPDKQDVGLESRGMKVRQPRAPKKVNPSPPPSDSDKPKRVSQSRETRQANLAERALKDDDFLETFDPATDWLPPNTAPEDYTPEYCSKLERHYWRTCGLGKSAWYGADTQGTLFTPEDEIWNVGRLESALTRLLPPPDASGGGLPGVNTPYLYFGMWRATFAWHVEDMDLYSINYIHFGAPKFWYAVPQARAGKLESMMRTYFPKDTSQCPQFLRHKSYLASPTILAKSSARPNTLVQQPGEFVITYPRGYHAGFNLGFNCAESVNFALDCWLDMGRKAGVCECVSDSVRIDVDQLLRDRERDAAIVAGLPFSDDEEGLQGEDMEEVVAEVLRPKSKSPRKRKVHPPQIKTEEPENNFIPTLKIPLKRKPEEPSPRPKKKSKFKTPSSPSKVLAPSPTPKLVVRLKLGPKPDNEPFPCCLCVSREKAGLLKVATPPKASATGGHTKEGPTGTWMAHEQCAMVIPETWVDEQDLASGGREKIVFGVDAVVKDRWNLKCSACSKTRFKAHGAPVQCTKGKCPKAFHVSCARTGHTDGILFEVVRHVEKEVVIYEAQPQQHYPAMQYSIPPTTMNPADLYSSTPQVSTTVMGMDVLEAAPQERVLKSVKKLQCTIICPQHNPVGKLIASEPDLSAYMPSQTLAAQKKASKQEKIKADLLALPTMSRIKIRVSSGVFEVSLIRVVEETGSVEVLWDRGQKRDFKWGVVVWGNTEGPVQQKPADVPDPVPAFQQSGYHPVAGSSTVPTDQPTPSSSAAGTRIGTPVAPSQEATPSTSASTSTSQPPTQSTASSSVNPYLRYTQQTQQAHAQGMLHPYANWTYAPQQVPYGMSYTYQYPTQLHQHYQHPQYTSGTPTGATVALTGPGVPAPAPQTYAQPTYANPLGTSAMDSRLQWQSPYTGPPTSAQAARVGSTTVQRTSSNGTGQPSGSQPKVQASTSSQYFHPSIPNGNASDVPQTLSSTTTPTSTLAPVSSKAPSHVAPHANNNDVPLPRAQAPPPKAQQQLSVPYPDMTALARLSQSELTGVLRDNPDLRNQIVAAAGSAALAAAQHVGVANP